MESREEKIRANDHQINGAFSVLRDLSPKGQELYFWYNYLNAVALLRPMFIEVYHHLRHRKWRFESLKARQHIQPYDTYSVVFAWGTGITRHTPPWAPVPRKRLKEVAARKHRVCLVHQDSVCPAHAAGYEDGLLIQDHFLQRTTKLYGICDHRKK